jgi:hypothetical protein
MNLCEVCQALRPVIHYNVAGGEIPHPTYIIHQESLEALQVSCRANCYICVRLHDCLSVAMWFHDIDRCPLVYYLVTTMAREGENLMSTASLRFYGKSDTPGESGMMLIDTFHCIPLAPGKCATDY